MGKRVLELRCLLGILGVPWSTAMVAGWLALVVVVLVAIGCVPAGRGRESPIVAPAPATPGVPDIRGSEEQSGQASLGPIRLDPPGSAEPDGTLCVPETVRIWVDAERESLGVDFYAAPADYPGRGWVFWRDDRPRDGWGTSWQVPVPGTRYRLTAVGRSSGRESTVVVVWRGKPEDAPPYYRPSGCLTRVEGLPRAFMSYGWLGADTIVGVAGSTPVVYRLPSGPLRSLPALARRVVPSPDSRWVACDTGQGVEVLDPWGGHRLCFRPPERPPGERAEPEIMGGGLWSPAGDQVLFWETFEWDSSFYVGSIGTGEVRRVQTSLEDYFLTSPVGWVSDRQIVFTTRAARKKDGTKEYSHGYRSDLAVADLEEGTYRLITDAPDGVFIEGLVVTPRGVVFRQWEEGKEGYRYGLLDLAGRVVCDFPDRRLESVRPSGDGRWLACLREVAGADVNRVLGLDVWTDGVVRHLCQFVARPDEGLTGPWWSPDGRSLLFSHAVFEPGPTPGTYQTRYYTFVVAVDGSW